MKAELPIHIRDTDFRVEVGITDDNCQDFCTAVDQEKAEFIVNVCNSHNRLVEALEIALNYMPSDHITTIGHPTTIIKQALAEAKGGHNENSIF